MGKELSNYMPNESVLNQAEVNPLQKFFSEARTREEDFDPQKISKQIARNFCEPSNELYKRNPKLAENPIKAIESVNLVGGGEKEIADPVEGLLLASAKLETAKDQLNLQPKQAEVFNGFLENIHGAAAFLRNKTVRGVATGALIVSQALTAAGCKGVIPTYVDPEPTISPTVEVIDIPTPTPTTEVLPTQTEVYPIPDINSYPVSSEHFMKGQSISGEEAEKRITELGAGESLDQMKDWYRANGISETNMLPILYEGGGWNLAAKTDNGNFLMFSITSGPEAGQVVRAMGMASYLYERPSFKTYELKTPDQLSGSSQEMVWDESGWNVIVTFKDEVMTGWFNADQNVWVVENTQPAPTETVQAEEPLVYMNDRIEYGGRQFDFKITALPSDKTVMLAFEKFGIESIAINEDKPNSRELLAKTIIYSFLKTYNFQNNANISLEEYVNNPEKYPASIMMKDENGEITEQKVTVDQINTFEMRYSNGMDGELYMGMYPKTSLTHGYSFKDGKFTFFSPLSPADQQLEFAVSANMDKVTELPYNIGYFAVYCEFSSSLGLMPYTVFRIKELGDTKTLINEPIFEDLNKINESLWPGGEMSRDEGQAWIRTHSSFMGQ